MAEGREMSATGRIDAIDLARGLALLAMAVFHFAWDLEFFGYAEPGMTQQFGWKLFARCIAASFLILVGISLFLAHRHAIRWRSFGIRLAQIGGAAAMITAVTALATPDRFIFFGILHQIALASLLGLAFLRLPAPLLLILAAGCVAARQFLRLPVFDHPGLWWIGLAPLDPESNDYVPLFPWFGAVLAGIALARIADSAGVLARLAGIRAGRAAAPLRFAGRHGLAFYLLHQPVLIGGLWLYSQIGPAPLADRDAALVGACLQSCLDVRDEAWCQAYCACVLERVGTGGMLDEPMDGPSDMLQGQMQAIAGACQAQIGEGP